MPQCPSLSVDAARDVDRRVNRTKTKARARNTIVRIPGATYLEVDAFVRLIAEVSDTEL